MTRLTRRAFVGAMTTGLAMPGILRAETLAGGIVARNSSGFHAPDWREHFPQTGRVAVLADTRSRALHYWNADRSDYRVYPTSVPRTDELTKRGFTEVVRKKIGPDWTPTPSMLAEDPSLHYMPPGPGNPLGTHALYLGWPAYLIHGTHDTRKIGRRSSSGCIGLYNEMIAELFELVPVGAQVRLI